MELTTSGRFRVLASPRDRSELLLIDVDADEADEDAFAPTYVSTMEGEADLAETVAALEPGNLVDATLEWTDGTARFDAVNVVNRTTVEFADGVTGIFEAARETWHEAETAGEAMNSRVTRNTDGEPNGVVYVFAKQQGARDLFDEFRRGALPLEPLVRRVNEGRDDDDERAVFVMRPADEPFVLVYIVFRRDGMLASTVRDTYGLRS